MRNLLLAAVAAVALAPSAGIAQTTAFNSTPTDGWFFGSGNNYAPANTVVLTTAAADQLYLRWHVRTQPAPASTGPLYSFASSDFNVAQGRSLSFDWGFDEVNTASDVTGASLTVLNVGTNQSVTYNAFDPLGLGSNTFNDNAVQNGSTQNSARVDFGFIFGSGSFNPNVDALYRVTLNVQGLSGGSQSLSADAQIGAGVAVVPEPATWAMMLAGFGLVGAAARRRRTTLVTA